MQSTYLCFGMPKESLKLLNPEDVFEYKIDEILENMKDTEVTIVLKIFSLIFYHTQNNTDIIELYKLLDLDSFIKVISLYDGRTVKFPTREIMKNHLLLSLLYYCKEVEGKDWEVIKKEFPFDISSISYGIQIKNLNNFIKQKLSEIVKKVKKKAEKGDIENGKGNKEGDIENG